MDKINPWYDPQTIGNIIAIVSRYYGLTPDDIQQDTRSWNITNARQVAMYFSRKYTRFSNGDIGSILAGRNSSTVLHACKTIEARYSVDARFQLELDEIEKIILTL